MEDTEQANINSDWLIFRSKQSKNSIDYYFSCKIKTSQSGILMIYTKFNPIISQDKSLFATGVQFQYTYQISSKSSFYAQNGLHLKSPSEVKLFLKQNYKKFDFGYLPAKICFNNKQNFDCKLLGQCADKPFECFFRGIMAFYIKKLIQEKAFYKEIDNFWKKMDLKIEEFNWQKSEVIANAWLKSKMFLQGLLSHYQGEPFEYNSSVFTQSRMRDGSIKDKYFVFYASSITSEIFKICRQNSNNKIYIHGQSGIGKSISLSLLVILSNEITELKMSLPSNEFIKFFEIDGKELQQFNAVPKYLYFSLDEHFTNRQRFYRTISYQLPKDFMKKNYPYYELIYRIQKYYDQIKMPIAFIIDQINQYYSYERQYMQQKQNDKNDGKVFLLQQEVKCISTFLKQIKRNPLILGSSQNLQFTVIPTDSQLFAIDQIDKKYKIEYQKIGQQSIMQQQRAEIVFFQIINQYTIKGLEKEKCKQLLERYSCFLQPGFQKKNYSYFSDFTHERVKKFFKVYPQAKKNFQVQTFQNIHDYIIECQSIKYSKFLQKGDTQMKGEKFRLILKIRLQAKKILENDIDSQAKKFQCKITERENLNQNQCDALFKQHAQIQGNKLIIYYSPKTFLAFTDFINEKIDLWFKYTKEFLSVNDGGVFFGMLCQNTYNYLLSKQINCIIDAYYVLIQTGSPCHFEAFTKMLTKDQIDGKSFLTDITKNTSIYTRFQRLFCQLKDIKELGNKFQFVFATPVVTNHMSLGYARPSNSQAIDFILIRNNSPNYLQQQMDLEKWNKVDWEASLANNYHLKTYEYCTSFDKEKIKEKINKAQVFFRKFVLISKMENTFEGRKLVNQAIKSNMLLNKKHYAFYKYGPMNRKYQFDLIQHTIILPYAMRGQFQPFKRGQVAFNFTSFEKIELKVSLDEDKAAILSLQAIKERLSKQNAFYSKNQQ